MNNPFGNLLYIAISLSIYKPISCQPKIWDTCLLGSLVESIYKNLSGIIFGNEINIINGTNTKD